jgi:dipicolinate synthase subunit B
MDVLGKKIGFCVTGSFCTLDKTIAGMIKLVDNGADVFPIFSYVVANTDTRFSIASEFRLKVEKITGKKVLDSIVDVEPLGPRKLIDVMVIAPCTGNSLSKLINGITDTPVLMAAKGQLRNQRPVVLSISTNDALGNNAKNLGMAMNTKNIYLVPFSQDDPISKCNSIVADMDRLIDTISFALDGKQVQPVII